MTNEGFTFLKSRFPLATQDCFYRETSHLSNPIYTVAKYIYRLQSAEPFITYRDTKTFSGYSYTFEGFTFLTSGIYSFQLGTVLSYEHKYSTDPLSVKTANRDLLTACAGNGTFTETRFYFVDSFIQRLYLSAGFYPKQVRFVG